MTDTRLSEQIGYLIARANRMLEEDLAKRLMPGGIAIEQYRVLKVLEQEGSQPMRLLAEQVLVEPATLTKIIDRMTADLLVFREADPKDRRKVLVALAPAGVALCAQIRSVSGAHETHIARAFPAGELDEIKRILTDLTLE